MILFSIQILCSFLIAMSLVFIVIQIKARFDNCFFIIGISNLLLCMFSAIDIWLQPTEQILQWTKFQHIIASFFPPFIVWYMLISAHKGYHNAIRWLFIAATLISLTFFTDLMLVQIDSKVVGTTLYTILFAPYILVAIASIIVLNVRELKKGTPSQRRFFLMHLFGVLILSVSGVADMFVVLRGIHLVNVIPSFTIIGILFFSVDVNILFIEKLTSIILEREETYKKLRNAYRELEDIQPLKELGQSAAMINHELRNYIVAISGYTELLFMKGELNDYAQRMTKKIIDSISRLSNYSKDILDFSKSSIIKTNVPINLAKIIMKCIDNNFEKNKDQFTIDYETSKEYYINGDWYKLDQIFVNLFKNAFEADASIVTVRLRQTKSTVRCQISDNGKGCEDASLSHLFKAFYTTKKSIGGTGLGLCVVKSIIEGHGGRISAFSKKHTKGVMGLGLNLVFPVFDKKAKKIEDEKSEILFITHGIKELSTPLQIFRNSLVNPHIFKGVKDIDLDTNFKEMYAVIGIAESIHQFKSRFKTNIPLYALIEEEQTGLFILDAAGEGNPILFSEEFLLNQILSNEILDNVYAAR